MIYRVKRDVSGRSRSVGMGYSAPGGGAEPVSFQLNKDHLDIWAPDKDEKKEMSSRNIIINVRPISKLPALPNVNVAYSIVNESVKKLIEEMEPGRHCFVPMKTLFKDGKTEAPLHYALFVTQTAQAVDLDNERIKKELREWDGREYIVFDSIIPEELKFDPSKCEGIHIWRDPVVINLLLMSEEMRDAFRSKGFRGADLGKCTII